MVRDKVTFTEFEILTYIYKTSRNLGNIADFLGVTVDSASVYISRLKKKEYVSRNKIALHGRNVYQISQKGRELVSEVASRITETRNDVPAN